MSSISYSLKTRLRAIVSKSPVYTRAKHQLEQPFDEKRLQQIVQHAIKNVPFYRDYPRFWLDNGRFDDLPILNKKDIIGRERQLVDQRIPSWILRKGETGGTSGISLTLYNTPMSQIRRFAMADSAMNEIGTNLRMATLRGFLPANNQIAQVVDNNHILLSSYRITHDTINQYISMMQQQRIECLHAYPSALLTLCKYLEQTGKQIHFPHLKGILTSSEVFSADIRQLARRIFPEAKLVDYFGQSEAYCAAYAVNDQPYHFNQSFGYTEFIDTGQTTPNGNRIAEIVATNILCDTMQFIRMATDDFVELDQNNQVVSIIGREADFLIDRHNAPIAGIAIFSDEAFSNLTGFQYYQPEPGKLVFRVVTNQHFNEAQRQLLIQELSQTFVSIDCDVEVVNEIPKTAAGKQKRVLHDFDIKPYLK